MDDVVAAELFESPGSMDRIGHGHVIPHDFDPKVASGFRHQLDGFFVSLSHHDNMRRTGLCHQLGFQPSAIHCL